MVVGVGQGTEVDPKVQTVIEASFRENTESYTHGNHPTATGCGNTDSHTRDAKTSQKKQKKPSIPGEHVEARLVMSIICVMF